MSALTTTRAAQLTPTRRAPDTADTDIPKSSLAASPAYVTNYKKHSLYGFEDRVVIDPGSRIWKIGFSGESEPRKVFWPCNVSDDEMWDLDLSKMVEEMKGRNTFIPSQVEEDVEEWDEDEKEMWNLIRARVLRAFKDAFIKHLLAEPHKRKVIIIENRMLSRPIKDIITDILIQTLEVPSVSFLPVHMIAPLAVGRTSALVVDIGHLETTVLPVVASRLLEHPCLQVSPIAGRSFLRRLRILILGYGQYKPPSMGVTSGRADVRDEDESVTGEGFGPVPPFILTRNVLEDIRIRGCFVAPPITTDPEIDNQVDDQGLLVHSNTMTEEESIIAKGLYCKYSKTTTVPDATFRTPHHDGAHASVGTLKIPGWIRARSAEIFFEGGDEDQSSVVEVVLESLLKIPIDLRSEMAASILVVGGGGMLQGFIPRLRLELSVALKDHVTLPSPGHPVTETLNAAALASAATSATLQARRSEVHLAKIKLANRFSALRGLRDRFAILNDVDPDSVGEDRVAGSAPVWSAGLMGWVGGSIAGALQVSGKEIMPPGALKDREKNVDHGRVLQSHRTRDRADHELTQTQRDDLTHQAERTAARRREIAAIPRSALRQR